MQAQTKARQRVFIRGPEPPPMMRHANPGIWLQLMDHLISQSMPAQQVHEHLQPQFGIFFPGREFAADVRAGGIHVGLVHGHPQFTMRFQRFHRPAGINSKKFRRFRHFPAALFSQPLRNTKMEKRDHRAHTAFLEAQEHFPVFIQGCLVPAVFFRLNARPLQ